MEKGRKARPYNAPRSAADTQATSASATNNSKPLMSDDACAGRRAAAKKQKTARLEVPRADTLIVVGARRGGNIAS